MCFSSIGEAGGGGLRSKTEGAAAVGRIALGDVVTLAEDFDITAGAGFELAAGAAVGFEALRVLVPIVGGGDHGERHKPVIPAEAAVGFAPQCEVEPCFSVGQEDGKVIVGGLRNALSTHGAETVADHEDHQRPEADHDPQEGREVA